MEDHYAHAISSGNGQPVILIHGLAASLYEWTGLIPALASNGFAACALDLLGHGESAKPEDPRLYHIESVYHHFRDWLDSLNLNSPPILIGHSLGGYLSLVHAIRRPEVVRCLVLIDPYFEAAQISLPLRLAKRRPALGVKAVQMAPQWLIQAAMSLYPVTAAYFPREARRQVAADCKRASPYFTYITYDIPDLTGSLLKVNVPVLVIWGEHDQTLRPASFPRLVQSLPNATGYQVPVTGHQPHISKPDLTNRVMLEFLSKWKQASTFNFEDLSLRAKRDKPSTFNLSIR
jgi:pimeloyl-ACP methyl ester carboxylesterase